MKKLIKRTLTFVFTLIAKRSLGNYTSDIRANRFTVLTKNTKVGKNINFNGCKLYGNGNCTFGDNFHSGFGLKILTTNHNYLGNKIPYDETYIDKDIVIGNNVWVGINVTILGGVSIGDGAIIQAGSVVVSDIDELGIAGGHPAKVFSYRDKTHYLDLVKKEAYF